MAAIKAKVNLNNAITFEQNSFSKIHEFKPLNYGTERIGTTFVQYNSAVKQLER